MKEILKLLRAGVTKSDYPVYGQYLHSTGKQLQTYNKSILVCINHKLPFKGSTNFFVLENMLTNIENYDISQEKDSIKIESGKFKSSLIIDNVGFPRIKDYNYKKGLMITEDLLYILNYAVKFTGDYHYKYVVITDKGVVATDSHVVFCYNKPTGIESNIFLDKTIINMLKVGYEINTDDSMFVKFDNGYMVFEIDDISEYNTEHLYDYILNYSNGVTKLCNIQSFHDAIQKVSSVLFNEISKCINVFNKKKLLSITAESYVNGISSIEFESEVGSMYEGRFNIDMFNNVSLDYDIYINLDNNNYMYLKNENSEIILIGDI